MSPERRNEGKQMVGRLWGIPIWIEMEFFDNVVELRNQGLSADEVANQLNKQVRVVRQVYKNLERREKYNKGRS